MTTQPLNNERAAAPFVGNQTQQNVASHVDSKSSSLSHQTQLTGLPLLVGDSGADDVLSGTLTTTAKETAGRLVALEGANASRSLKAQAVRTSKAVEEQMETMQEKVSEIVNSYPPFLRGSEKRQKYLMSISSIRHQIEAMTIPPNKSDNPVLDEASASEAKSIWKDLFQNVDIPVLTPNGTNEASDADLKSAYYVIDAMKKDLSGRRAALEQQFTSSMPVSAPIAQFISQVMGQELAQSALPMTSSLVGVLKGI